MGLKQTGFNAGYLKQNEQKCVKCPKQFKTDKCTFMYVSYYFRGWPNEMQNLCDDMFGVLSSGESFTKPACV